MLTYRESKYISARLQGKTKVDSAKAAGFSPAIAHNAGVVLETPEVKAELERLQRELVDSTLSVGLADAAELHEYLTSALRADIRDIRNDDGTFKPQSEWPEIWGRMCEAGDVEVERSFERSKDGGDKSWDEKGTVTKVKLKFTGRAKLIELLMRHKGVNALVESKQPDVHVHLHAEVTQRLADGRKRVEEFQQRTIEGEATPVENG
jgi:phage terminase small subunit